jgi:hypothetical protein
MTRRGELVRPSITATVTFKPLQLPPFPATDGKGVAVHLVVVARVLIRPGIVQLAWCGWWMLGPRHRTLILLTLRGETSPATARSVA